MMRPPKASAFAGSNGACAAWPAVSVGLVVSVAGLLHPVDDPIVGPADICPHP
jgi:hypothetical protein